MFHAPPCPSTYENKSKYKHKHKHKYQHKYKYKYTHKSFIYKSLYNHANIHNILKKTYVYIYSCYPCSNFFLKNMTPLAVGVSESMVHPAPPNSPDAKSALYSNNNHTCPNSVCIRLPDSQILWILRFSERLLETHHLYRGQSGRSRL